MHTRRWSVVVVAALALHLALPLPLVAAGEGQGMAMIRGFVQTAAGNPVGGQIVRLRSLADGAVIGTATTDPNGGFSFGNLETGTYIVEAISAETVRGTSTAVMVTDLERVFDDVLVILEDNDSGFGLGFGGPGWSSADTVAAVILGFVGGGTAAFIATKDDASGSR